jgi:hypothetical protein
MRIFYSSIFLKLEKTQKLVAIEYIRQQVVIIDKVITKNYFEKFIDQEYKFIKIDLYEPRGLLNE